MGQGVAEGLGKGSAVSSLSPKGPGVEGKPPLDSPVHHAFTKNS